MTWLTWVIAVLCAAAVGARMGRLTVRPPSLARSSVAAAAIAVAVAAAVRTPTVAVILGPPDSDVPMLTFIGCWVVVATATALIASAASPRVGRQTLEAVSIVIPTVAAVVLVAMSVTGEMAIGSIFVIIACLFALVIGVRYIAWNPLGRAISYYLVGIAVVTVVLALDPSHTEPASRWWAVSIIILSVSCCSVMIESWFVARRDLRRTRALLRSLVAAHPELGDGDYQSATTVLRADDRVSQILDGLYLHAGAGLIAPDPGDDAAGPRQRARAIAAWLRDPDAAPVDPRLLTTPDELSDRRWVRLIAREYDRAPTAV
ncbi:hypothetical protein [Gordonia neofelifaecis]|uniref:Uncharacterized protein n=1 Tax=Gordonia neofelifaecis NRRL B-59395 TaxID=644548 RepID=F1YNR5_9ACTN|nr:hypothetical protein [Gordonia neofelifaecis]EGD53672.1 hypothetical protein SCNU_17807 [Gordonia neofelifaecis NRRL B-59395]